MRGALVVDLPASVSQQSRNPAVAISAILARQFGHISDQAFIVSTAFRQWALCGSVLAQNATNPSLRNLELTANMIDAGPPTRGGQKFRYADLRFPMLPPVGSACPMSGQKLHAVDARSLSLVALVP